MRPTEAPPGARATVSRETRNAIIIAAVIEAVVLIPALIYLVFWSGR